MYSYPTKKVDGWRFVIGFVLAMAVSASSTFAKRPDMLPGAPRPWEGALAVNPHSIVNVFDGNVSTVLPIAG